MLYPQKFFKFIRPVHVHLKMDKWDYLRWPMTALTREIGDGPCFLYIKFSWIGVYHFLMSVDHNFDFKRSFGPL